ncbi:hypothetical protein LH128_01157 [Sphingomonas sp. LH128]|uniref:hypothetical protein n=1 Tax=Sphingomonas sp. LH128 TaxID=473781 RepID=UPI00027CC1FF|nr:hypothetical protein [Sphingomonas sp. LH128]EJU14941.1 hypothetical protein LH128_01157 [Sphingomonas sp. LH128]
MPKSPSVLNPDRVPALPEALSSIPVEHLDRICDALEVFFEFDEEGVVAALDHLIDQRDNAGRDSILD